MNKLYMLDTDTASYIIKGTHPELLKKFASKIDRICISSITLAELKFGAAKKNLLPLTQKINAFCELVAIKDFDSDAAREYGIIRAQLEKSGTPLVSMDLLIAATAIANKAILVTNNTAHFSKVSSLKLDNWITVK